MYKHKQPPAVTPELKWFSRIFTAVCGWLSLRQSVYVSGKALINGCWEMGKYDRAEMEVRRAIAPGLRAFAPNLSYCSHCGWPWNVVRSHVVDYEGGGFFVVCEFCYNQLRNYGRRDQFVAYNLELCDEWNDAERDSAWFMKHIERDWPERGRPFFVALE